MSEKPTVGTAPIFVAFEEPVGFFRRRQRVRADRIDAYGDAIKTVSKPGFEGGYTWTTDGIYVQVGETTFHTHDLTVEQLDRLVVLIAPEDPK